MKITKRQLKRIIREETTRLQETGWVDRWVSDVDYPSASIEVDWAGKLADLAQLADIGLKAEVVDPEGPAGGAPIVVVSGPRNMLKAWYVQEYSDGDPSWGDYFEDWVEE